jgi:hypothetical protein
MATTAELTEDLRKAHGKSCLTIRDVARYIGVNEHDARTMLKPVPYIITGEKGKGKRYPVREVAKMLYARQVKS